MRRHLRSAVILILTLALLALFLRGVDLRQVGREISRAQWSLLIGALGLTALTYLERALRWQYLLRPLGAASFRHAFRATVIGFAATSVLPARAGEVIRPYLLARHEGLSATATFATIIVERLLDLVTVLALFGVYLLAFDPGLSERSPAAFEAVRFGGIVVALCTVLVGTVLVWAAAQPESLERLIGRADRVLPARLVQVLSRVSRSFAEGLAAVRQPQRLLGAIVWSVLLWLTIASAVWLVARAFHLVFPLSGTLLMLALLTVGVSLPTPGAVGGFHEAFRFGMTTFFASPNERAVGAAIVLHAISFVPVAIVGAIFMAQDGLSLARARKLTEGAAAG